MAPLTDASLTSHSEECQRAPGMTIYDSCRACRTKRLATDTTNVLTWPKTLGFGGGHASAKGDLWLFDCWRCCILGCYFFGTQASIYRCSAQTQATVPPLLVMKLELYQWFIPGNSKGMLHYEIPSTHQLGLFKKVGRMGDHVYFYDDDGSLQGHFSTKSNFISLYLSKDNLYEGTCTQTK